MSDPAADVSLRKDSSPRGSPSSRVASATSGDRTAARVSSFTESVIREVTGPSKEHRAINVAQRSPHFAAPEEFREAAVGAIRDDVDQNLITWGSRDLREEIAVTVPSRTAGERLIAFGRRVGLA
jgi:hypothetical protein